MWRQKNLKPVYFYLLAIIFCCFVLFFGYLHLPIVLQKEGATYYLRPGLANKNFVTEISQQGILPFPFLFSLYVSLQSHDQLKAGEYLFPRGSTPLSIWKQVTQGKGFFYRSFTIVPGWSFKQLREELSRTYGLRHLIDKLEEAEIMSGLGAKHQVAEGQFCPETYYYTHGVSDLVILKRSFNLMQLRLNEAWENKAAHLPYKNPYEALIAASIIEKEGFLDAERPIIAGVLINRLNRDMLLQFDPTVIYGLKERYRGTISKQDLLDDNPYNTYVHKGLPPTPIAMPSLQSLEAALHPQASNYLYFVAKGDGSHYFSSSLPQHHSAVVEFAKKHTDNQKAPVGEKATLTSIPRN